MKETCIVMTRIDKLIARLLSEPPPVDFSWDELVKLLSHLGYSELKTGKTGGSRRKFVDADKHVLSLHKPHPGNLLKRYQINDIIVALKERQKI